MTPNEADSPDSAVWHDEGNGRLRLVEASGTQIAAVERVKAYLWKWKAGTKRGSANSVDEAMARAESALRTPEERQAAADAVANAMGTSRRNVVGAQ